MSNRRLFLSIFVFFILLDIALAVYFYSLSPKSILTGPGHCLILEEKYCKKVAFINDPIEKDGLLAVYKIPAGTPIYAPARGYFSKGPTFYFENKVAGGYITYPGSSITIAENNSIKVNEVNFGFIYFEEEENQYYEINKGEIIGKVSEKNINFLGDYNLAVRITRKTVTNEGFVFQSDTSQLKQLLNVQ
ncbi:MAG: hypothetical protein QHH09_00620 [Microgenomates group bacterium]|nr:hypothetical protein [Microgenomates group bacterium]